MLSEYRCEKHLTMLTSSFIGDFNNNIINNIVDIDIRSILHNNHNECGSER